MPKFHGRDCPACAAALEIIPALATYLDPNDTWSDVDDGGVLVAQRLAEITAAVLHRYPLGQARSVQQNIDTVGLGASVVGAVIGERRTRW